MQYICAYLHASYMHISGICGVGFHLNGKTLQSRVVNMVFPHVFETRGGRLHTSYRCGCFTNPYQTVILWWKKVGLAEGELLGLKDTEGTE